MDFPIDIETGKLSPDAQKAVKTTENALKKTGHVAEESLEHVSRAAVLALIAAGHIRIGE